MIDSQIEAAIRHFENSVDKSLDTLVNRRMKPNQLQPWLFEIYSKLKENPHIYLDNSFEKARVFTIDFERAFNECPQWFKFYLEAKAEGQTDEHIASCLRMSKRTLLRRLEDYGSGKQSNVGKHITFAGLSTSKLLAFPTGSQQR